MTIKLTHRTRLNSCRCSLNIN